MDSELLVAIKHLTEEMIRFNQNIGPVIGRFNEIDEYKVMVAQSRATNDHLLKEIMKGEKAHGI